MVFNENTNYDFILLSKQGRTPLIYLTELTTEHVFATCFWDYEDPISETLTYRVTQKDAYPYFVR